VTQLTLSDVTVTHNRPITDLHYTTCPTTVTKLRKQQTLHQQVKFIFHKTQTNTRKSGTCMEVVDKDKYSSCRQVSRQQVGDSPEKYDHLPSIIKLSVAATEHDL